MIHEITYGVSNSATCSCGWDGHGTLAQDLDMEIARHIVEAYDHGDVVEDHDLASARYFLGSVQD